MNLGPGTYEFGAWLSFGTDQAAGNFDQGQVSVFVSGPNISNTQGTTPGDISSSFTIAGGSGFSFTPWMLFSGILTYSGPGDAPFLLNISVQQASDVGGLILLADNAFIAPVPLPATLPLFASGLAGLGWLSRRRKRTQAAA